MKKYTQAEFDAIPRDEYGIKNCPTGNYTEIKDFGAGCIFDERCSFGAGCRFGAGCSFDTGCSFGKGCSFGAGCSFGEECSFDAGCSFGARCIFGAWCIFGARCSFGARCIFGEGCRFGAECFCEFGKFSFMIAAGGFGSRRRTTYFFRLADGSIGVRCGCFAGMLPEWRAKVRATHGDSHIAQAYLLIADAVEMQWRDVQ